MSVCCCYCCFCCCYCCRTRTRFLVSQACQVQYFVYLVLNRTDCLARQRYTKRVSSLARALNKPRSGSWLPACLTWSVSEYGSGSESVSVSLCLAVALALGPGAWSHCLAMGWCQLSVVKERFKRACVSLSISLSVSRALFLSLPAYLYGSAPT